MLSWVSARGSPRSWLPGHEPVLKTTPVSLTVSLRTSGCSRGACFHSCRLLNFFFPSVPCKVCMGQSPCYFQSWFSNQKKKKLWPKSWEPLDYSKEWKDTGGLLFDQKRWGHVRKEVSVGELPHQSESTQEHQAPRQSWPLTQAVGNAISDRVLSSLKLS